MAARESAPEAADAVVIGAGFAGVTAARDLKASGLEHVVLLEARDRLGGRTWTDELDGTLIELGGGWVHWSEPHVWAEITRYGIEITEDDWEFDATLMGDPLGRVSPDAAFEQLRQAVTRYMGDSMDLLPRPYDPLFLEGDALSNLDAISMAERLERMSPTPEERDLLTCFLHEIAGSPLEQAAIMPVIRWLALTNGDAEQWFHTSRYRPVDGTRSILDAMLADGRVDVRLRSAVEGVESRVDGVRVVTASGEVIDARGVVVATPVNLWPTIEFTPELPASHRDAARVGMGKPHQDKIWAWVRGAGIGRVFGQVPGIAPMNWFWTYKQEGDRQLIIGINADPTLDVGDHDQVADVLQGYVPEIEEVLSVKSQNWAADPFSRGGNTCHRPRQMTEHLRDLQQPWGRVSFATADIASGWVGYMDGAIESGIRAARLCRESIAGADRAPRNAA